jgi:ribosomal protein L11 methyltransferase
MKYIKLVIVIDDAYQENLIAELQEMDFDAFEQQDNKIITFVVKERFNDVHREHIERLLAGYPGNGFIQSEEVDADQNWNEAWEQTIKPQQIGPFFVKPTWSRRKSPSEAILLEIDPKMSFGTGYHETTRLILKLLPDIVRPGHKVLDAGTGTGILAIAALKLNAEYAFGFDIDAWSITNARENMLLNKVEERMEVELGSVEVIPSDKEFDLILANINRNTLLDLMASLVRHLSGEGNLILSGLLESDEARIGREANRLGLKKIKKVREKEWIAVWFGFSPES